MKRREILGTAAALTGVTVVGCGGGGEGEISETNNLDRWSPTAYTIPSALVPIGNTQYQVEVVFTSKRAVTVNLSRLGLNSYIGSKPVTSHNTHKVEFALLRCTKNSGSKNTDFGLTVFDHQNNVLRTVGYNASQTADNYRQYSTHNFGESEYEWNFYAKDNLEHLVSVRFFEIPSDEHISFNSGEYVRYIANTAKHSNAHNQTITKPNFWNTTISTPEHDSRVIGSSGSGDDSLLLRNHRKLDHHEIMPTYLGASPAEKPLIGRRLKRHAARFGIETRKLWGQLSASNPDESYLLNNEILRCTGGKKLVDYFRKVKDEISDTMSANFEQIGNELYNLCSDNLSKLSSQAMIDSTRKLQDNFGEELKYVSGGVSASTNAQVNLTLAKAGASFLMGSLVCGAGIRVSFGLARASVFFDGLQTNTYSVGDINDKGAKVGFVLILKMWKSDSLSIGGASMDIELTLHTTLLRGKFRLDMIQAELVFDLDTRSLVGKMFRFGIERLYSSISGSSRTPSFPTSSASYAFANPLWMSNANLPGQLGGFAETLGGATATILNQQISGYVRSFSNYIGTNIVDSNKLTRYYGVFEVGIARFLITNGDLNDPTIGVNAGWNYGATGWCPGFKYIGGIGSSGSTGAVSGYLRVVTILDVYALYGNSKYLKTSKFTWSF